MPAPRREAPRRRALIRGTLVGAGALGLAACGQTPGAGAPASGGSAVRRSVLFWQWGAGYVDGFADMVKEFNGANNGVTVNFEPGVVSAGSTNYWDKLTAALAGSVGPADFHNISTALINDAWDGKIAMKEALTQAQDQINALIQQAGA